MRKILAYILIALMICCYAAVHSCTTTKHTNQTVTFDSTSIKEAKISKHESDSLSEVFLKRIKELETNVQFGNVRQCDDDSLRAIIADLNSATFLNEMEKQSLIDRLNDIKAGVVPTNEVTTHPDGSTTYKGQIKSFTQKLKESTDSVTKLQLKVSEQDSVIKELKKNSGTVHTIIDKKTTWFPWWLLLVAFVAGMAAMFGIGYYLNKK